MINEHTRVKLAGSAHPFLRAANVIQFGADATRTGLVTTDHAEDVAAVLATLLRPRQVSWVVDQLSALLGDAAARSLVDDLVSYRILVPATTPAVLLVGCGALTTSLATQLGESGLLVRTPARGEALSRFAGLPVPGPVVGLALLVLSALAWPALQGEVEEVADTLLRHLSLLFVPALFSLIHGGQGWLTGWIARRIGLNRPRQPRPAALDECCA